MRKTKELLYSAGAQSATDYCISEMDKVRRIDRRESQVPKEWFVKQLKDNKISYALMARLTGYSYSHFLAVMQGKYKVTVAFEKKFKKSLKKLLTIL